MVLIVKNLELATDAAILANEIFNTAIGSFSNLKIDREFKVMITFLGDDIASTRTSHDDQLAIDSLPAFVHITIWRVTLPTRQIPSIPQQLPTRFTLLLGKCVMLLSSSRKRYSTHKQCNKQQSLHTLFDFVILKPKAQSREKKPSLLGLLGVFEIVAIAAIGAAIALICGKLLVDNGFEIRPDLGVPLILLSQLLTIFWALICLLVTAIDTISLTLDFSSKHMGKIAIRAVILALLLSIPMLGITVFWGQLGALSMTWQEFLELLELYFVLFT